MSEHWHSHTTQICWTCKALVQGRTITHRDEIGEVHGWRLGAIIHKLLRKYHWPIESKPRGPQNIAHYRLVGRPDWRALNFPRSATRLRDELKEASTKRQSGSSGAFDLFRGVSDGEE